MAKYSVQFEDVPGVRYDAVDFFKIARIDDAFVLSCYQLDYQAAVDTLQAAGADKEDTPVPARLVCRMKMNEASFNRLHEVFQKIANVVKQ